MDAQLIVIIAGVILVAAIIGSLVFLRGYSGRFTFDTAQGTRPRAAQGEGNTQGVALKGRFKLLTLGVGAVFAAITAKLWSMQMVSSDHYDELAERNRTRTVTTPAPRGRILDRNGVALVENRPSLAVVAYRDLAEDTVLVRHLANVLGMPYMAVLRNIQDNTEGAQSLHTIATDVRRSTVAYIQEHPDEFPGVQIAERTERAYPHGALACHVLGYTGTITAEQLKAQEDMSEEERAGAVIYQSGDIVGQAGVEFQYEQLLQGVRGEQIVRVDADGNVTGQAGAVPPKPGSDIKLTLDLKIQQACEEGLKLGMETAKQMGKAAPAGVCMCLDCTNGDVLGMASAPTFEPSVFVGGVSSDVWNELNREDGYHPLINRAVSGQYMSASTIKPLSAYAGMEYGVYTADMSSNCTGWWTGLGEANGKHCWNHKGHGVRNLQTGIRDSCDAVFYDVGKNFFYDERNPDGLQEMFRRWGLGEVTGIDLPSEAAGRVPDAEWKEGYFKDWPADQRAWNAGDMTNIVIGQGDILVTPLQMATVYAGIAQDGVEPVPHVLLSAVARDGQGDAYTFEPKTRLTADIKDQRSRDVVAQGLLSMIYEETPSTAAHFTNLPVKVAGKSGTGEKAGFNDFGWFITYAPFEDPKYVVACLVEEGGFGSNCAMPAVRHVLGAIYDAPDTAAYTAGDSTR
ncbi:penicillin-binding protein 2 [Corynebacterium sp.]|uniref:penicillin-binding protein 2 n=1 Tax=Corynebacterium sp. TaxID=1720 RepID=UPI0026DD499E|nr:penicillin-binding protein 2 [Corynebacterium sp.]MDO5032537.1 penicillin-binding protein 2 [Corynebacterium sp.]